MIRNYSVGDAYLAPLPFESAVSSIWRFTWRNVLSPAMLLPLVSARKSYSSSEHGADEWLCTRKVHDLTGWVLYGPMEAAFFEGGWDRRLWRHEELRFCPICLGDAYHSYWHQSAFLDACPWHHVELRTRCACCGMRTPTYGLSRKILATPYLCHHCNAPLSGVAPLVENRRHMQENAGEIDAWFRDLSEWWLLGVPVRARIRSMLFDKTYRAGEPRIQSLARAMLQEACGRAPRTKQFNLPIERMVWQRAASSPMLVNLTGPLYPEHYTEYVRRAYRRTVQFLERRIGDAFPFTLEEYRRHMRFRLGADSHLQTSRFQPHLLALAVMRRCLEAALNYLTVRDGRYHLRNIMRSSCMTRMTRTFWRAAFLSMYAGSFERVVTARGGKVSAEKLTEVGFNDVFACVQTRSVEAGEGCAGAFFEFGEAVWPGIPGLTLVHRRGRQATDRPT
jgi:hypothetical protein